MNQKRKLILLCVTIVLVISLIAIITLSAQETLEPVVPAAVANKDVGSDIKDEISQSVKEAGPDVKDEISQSVGVLFAFPVSYAYKEDQYHIRATLAKLVDSMKRDKDQLNMIPYDITGTAVGWSNASDTKLTDALKNIQTTAVLEPNYFGPLQKTISSFEELKDISKKYFVMITDGEGANVENDKLASQLISASIDDLKEHEIIPIVIGYSPFGVEEMPHIDLLKRLAAESGGQYFQAESFNAFEKIMQEDVYQFIYK